jgi:predicted regulator of Ras-like GTPase activity (Roadblock/LC7/MglB family)
LGGLREEEIMDKFTERLKILLENIDGGCEALFCGYDGLTIARHISNQTPLDGEILCANFVSVIKTLQKTSANPKDIIVTFEKHTIFIRILDDGFVCVIMNVDGNLGRAKLECSKLTKDFTL